VEGVLALAVLGQLAALVRQAVVEEQEVVVLPAPTEEEVEVVGAAPLADLMVVVQPAEGSQPLDKVKVEVVPLVVEQPKEVVQPKEQLVGKKTQQPHQVVNLKTHPKVGVVVENPNPNKKR
jgi:hypothetical protein